jgi:hypothetical protein
VSTAENKNLIQRIFAGLEIGNGLLLFESMRRTFAGSSQARPSGRGPMRQEAVANELIRPLRRKIDGAIKRRALCGSSPTVIWSRSKRAAIT